MLITITLCKFIRPMITTTEVYVETLRDKHQLDINSDGTECPTLVGTNNEHNKNMALQNISRNDVMQALSVTQTYRHFETQITDLPSQQREE